ncbi:hypothetical protein O988_05183 [Pseudogymnoascus sp. VKM F-3808]|nr:hypothetical protein O988_05183 [Pseudogymnoascus sp. VKM F-3808]
MLQASGVLFRHTGTRSADLTPVGKRRETPPIASSPPSPASTVPHPHPIPPPPPPPPPSPRPHWSLATSTPPQDSDEAGADDLLHPEGKPTLRHSVLDALTFSRERSGRVRIMGRGGALLSPAQNLPYRPYMFEPDPQAAANRNAAAFRIGVAMVPDSVQMVL